MKIPVGFYIHGYGWSAAKDWSNCGFWYLWVAWNHFLKDNEGHLDSCVPVLGSLHVCQISVLWATHPPRVSGSLCAALYSPVLCPQN